MVKHWQYQPNYLLSMCVCVCDHLTALKNTHTFNRHSQNDYMFPGLGVCEFLGA